MNHSVGRASRAAGVAITLLATIAGPMHAQELGRGRGFAPPVFGVSSAASISVSLENSRPDPRTTIRAPAATVSGAPRDFRTVTIRVPEAAPLDRDIEFESESAEDTPLLGTTSGVMLAGADRAHAIRLTVGIPARARAGVSQIAVVRFRTRESGGISPLVIEVPVNLVVQPVHHVELNLLQPALSAPPGQRVAIPVRLYSAGNLPDEVQLRIEAPSGWRSELPGGDASTPLPVHAVVDATLYVRVPLLANGGSWTVRVLAMREEHVAAEKSVSIAVINGAMSGKQSGARIMMGTTAAGGPWTGIASAVSLGIDGQLTEDVAVSGRAVRSIDVPYGSQVGLGRNGYSPGPPSLALSSARWRVNAGAQGIGFSDLTGVNGAAIGLSGGTTSAGWSSSMLAGRSIEGAGVGDGVLTGVGLTHPVREALVGFTLTHLDERGSGYFGARSLDAAGVSATVPLGRAIVSRNELAIRRTLSGTGLGASSHLSQHTERGSFELSFLSAPGGSAAFARASSELAGAFTRQLGSRIATNLGAWKSSDRGGFVSGIDTRGASIGSALSVTPSTTVMLEVRRSGFGTRSSAIRFGTDEESITTGLGWGSRVARLWASTTRGTTMRTTSIIGGVVIAERAPRAQTQVGATFTTGRGVLQIGASDDRHGAGTGLPRHRRQYGVQLDRVTLLAVGGTQVQVSGDYQRLEFGRSRAAVNVMRAGIRAETASGFNIVFDIERNPFYAASFMSSASTMWSVHIGQPIRLPRFGSRAGRGVAYRDLDGNGRRNGNEPALGGLAVRRGSETTVTDEQGQFRLATVQSGAPSLDARSLPLGSVTGAVSEGAQNRFELAVTTLAVVRVELFVVGADSSRVPRASLGAATLVARDSAGMSWVARTVEGGTLLFDGLPPGRYTLLLDVTDITEPLRPASELPVLLITSGAPKTDIRIGLRTRAVRIRKSASSSAS